MNAANRKISELAEGSGGEVEISECATSTSVNNFDGDRFALV
jgi:hypothetical protein